MLRVEKIKKDYKIGEKLIRALGNTSFELSSGECMAITGLSGSGKTTLLNIIGCICRPSSGKVFIDDREITALPEHFLVDVRRKKIGFIFQQFYLFPDLPVIDNLIMPLIPLGLSPGERKFRAEKQIERFGLMPRLTSRVAELSGGEQQRVAIARALVNDPTILLADEPTSNIDAETTQLVLDVLQESKNMGWTILVASHDPLVIDSDLVDRVYKIRKER
jgi:putative ABC transport system ATP-binding protein